MQDVIVGVGFLDLKLGVVGNLIVFAASVQDEVILVDRFFLDGLLLVGYYLLHDLSPLPHAADCGYDDTGHQKDAGNCDTDDESDAGR